MLKWVTATVFPNSFFAYLFRSYTVNKGMHQPRCKWSKQLAGDRKRARQAGDRSASSVFRLLTSTANSCVSLWHLWKARLNPLNWQLGELCAALSASKQKIYPDAPVRLWSHSWSGELLLIQRDFKQVEDAGRPKYKQDPQLVNAGDKTVKDSTKRHSAEKPSPERAWSLCQCQISQC